MKQSLIQFLTFNLVGIVNTLFGFSIIFTLMFLGVSAVASNFIGYFLGAMLSYTLNKKYTFKSDTKDKTEALKFFGVLLISYCINLLTLQWLLTFLNPYTAQLISAIVYTLSSFSLAKLFVFSEQNMHKKSQQC